MRDLLRRDLKLHKVAFVLPAVVALLGGLAAFWTGEPPIVFLVLSLGVVLLQPHALHLREEHHGTLRELRILPVTPRQIVGLRVVEGLLVALGVALLHGMLALVLQGPGVFQGLGQLVSPGWLWMLLMVLLVPLPVTLRWGGRGWMGLILGTFALGGGLTMLGQFEGALPFRTALFRALLWTMDYTTAHPWQHTLALLALMAACLPLSEAALRRRSL